MGSGILPVTKSNVAKHGKELRALSPTMKITYWLHPVLTTTEQ